MSTKNLWKQSPYLIIPLTFWESALTAAFNLQEEKKSFKEKIPFLNFQLKTGDKTQFCHNKISTKVIIKVIYWLQKLKNIWELHRKVSLMSMNWSCFFKEFKGQKCPNRNKNGFLEGIVKWNTKFLLRQ